MISLKNMATGALYRHRITSVKEGEAFPLAIKKIPSIR
jgi:hypothetical protein